MTTLILGTAEFNKEGYAGKPCPSEREIVRILNLAYEIGIRTLDCADTYNIEHVDKFFIGFKRINKSRKQEAEWYHYRPGELKFASKGSVYDVAQLAGLNAAIVPFSIADTRFANVKLPPLIYIRSVFNRGLLLEQGYTVRDCLRFSDRLYNAGIIVGVNSVKELEEIAKAVNI